MTSRAIRGNLCKTFSEAAFFFSKIRKNGEFREVLQRRYVILL